MSGEVLLAICLFVFFVLCIGIPLAMNKYDERQARCKNLERILEKRRREREYHE